MFRSVLSNLFSASLVMGIAACHGTLSSQTSAQDISNVKVLGVTTVGSSADEGDANTMTGLRVTVGGSDVFVKSLSAYVGVVGQAPNNQFSLAIYSDSGGVPGSLMASSAVGALRGDSWNSLPVSVTLKAHQPYWLMYNANGSSHENNLYYSNVSNKIGVYAPQSFGTWPASYRGAVLGSWQFSIFATLASANPGSADAGAQPPPQTDGGRGGDPGLDGGAEFVGAGCPAGAGGGSAPALKNVVATVDGTNVRVTFDPWDGARDYRVLALPASGSTAAATFYRCAGNSAVPYIVQDDNPDFPPPPMGNSLATGYRARVTSAVAGYTRSMPEATLGFVYTSPGAGRIPVYALGDPNLDADNTSCYQMRWTESRVKKYTASEAERTSLLNQRWRDDGIAFFVPAPGTAGARPVYLDVASLWPSTANLLLTDGKEHDARIASGDNLTPLFTVFTEPQPDTAPLMRVHYGASCNRSHDELTVGLARFEKAYQQGPQPINELHWSNLSGPVTLVVEALNDLCPYQGLLSPQSRPARTDSFPSYGISYPAFLTPSEIQARSPAGVLYVNGQGKNTSPSPVARSCVSVQPGPPPPPADYRFDGTVEIGPEQQTGFQAWAMDSAGYNVTLSYLATNEWGIGALFGELWFPHADWGADTNGKVRFTPKTAATLSDARFLHARMDVDLLSTGRRYPQLMISNVGWPVQDQMATGETLVTQTFGDSPVQLQVELCDHKAWDTNNQCPAWDLYQISAGASPFLAPNPEVNSLMGGDEMVRMDVFLSTSRVYTFLNQQPYGCVNLPSGKFSPGSATVTFGDILYHSGVDLPGTWYGNWTTNFQTQMTRHFSAMEFTSNVAAPPWDEHRFPCVGPGSATCMAECGN